jgi:PHD/YefM family antitoxin component YafN of YafNO toxin-antitoxin module
MTPLQDTHSLTDFIQNHADHLARLKASGKPEVLTIDGRAELVILDAECYQDIMDRLDRAETIAAIREGLASAERGELKDSAQVYSEMKARYGL